jgi:DNA mismatch repair protein MSH5
VVYINQLGFLISVQSWNGHPDPKSLETDQIHLVLQTDDVIFYRTPISEQLNNQFGDLHDKICQQERKICRRLIKQINEAMPELLEITKWCAKLDCMIAFTLVAAEKQFVRPKLTNEKCLYIQKGRHCLVEVKNSFVPNDTFIDLLDHKNLVNILSAPNAAGKSVYLKQVALICYLAHIGSFVPANEVQIGVLDAIYSRIYCPESVYKDCGSSFMADLQQMSRVVMNSTSSSLILIDEFGKGTNSTEGRVLFAACLENIIERGDAAPITIVSTHFPEIYNLLRVRTNVCLKTIKTERTEDGALQSLYQIVDGCNRGSYASEYKEAKRIIDEILMKNPSMRERSIHMVNNSYDVAMKSFILALLKIYLRDKRVDFQQAYTMYSKAIADIFMR